ncbi:MAG TPA: ankyrin repeat domain-containing protein [Patescibacteria group bacterium]|nr:ankyrin repeat domain-containing protein [Patescibacteria group bacterium]
MAPNDDDNIEDRRSNFEKAMDRLTGGLKGVFGDAAAPAPAPSSDNSAAAPPPPRTQVTRDGVKVDTAAFFNAVRRGNLDAIVDYIKAGGDLNIYNLPGDTPLHIAARAGNNDVTELLLRAGANPKQGKKNDADATPLEDAVNFGKVEVVETLVRHGGYIQGKMVDGRTLLHRAVEKGKTRMVVAMIRAGADANERTANGSTPLIMAVSMRLTEVAEALLEFPEVVRGINDFTNATDPKQRNSFQLAIERGLATVAGKMLKLGANVNQPDAEGVTPLGHALSQYNMPLVKTLVLQGADVNRPAGIGGLTPLSLIAGDADMTVAKKRAEFISFLIARGADPDCRAPDTGMSPLASVLLTKGGEWGASALLTHEIDTESRDDSGATPIYYTLHKSDTTALEMMINSGADVNARHMVDARTPLIEAVQQKNHAGLRLLLQAGANPKHFDSHNRSALSYARELEDTQAILLLERALKPPAPKDPPPKAPKP